MSIFNRIDNWFDSLFRPPKPKHSVDLNYFISKKKTCYVFRGRVFLFQTTDIDELDKKLEELFPDTELNITIEYE